MSNTDSTDGDRPDSRDDDFAELLRSAGRGPRLSETAHDRIRNAVEARWQAAVARRQAAGPATKAPVRRARGDTTRSSPLRSASRRTWRRRWFAPAAAAAMAGLLVVMLWQSPNVSRPGASAAFAELAAIEGAASITREDRVTAIGAGQPARVLLGDLLSTSSSGRLALRLAGDTELRLNVDTIVEITDEQAVRLIAGMIYFDAPPSAPHNDFAVRTGFGTVAHAGTQYTAGIGSEGLIVRVREGEAVVSDIARSTSESPVSAGPGEQLQVDSSGSVTRSAHPLDAPEWAWAQELARAPFDGPRSVLVVLEWAARATGREVRFDTAGARELADTAVLNEVGGLSPSEVLDVIGSTTNLQVSTTAAALTVNVR